MVVRILGGVPKGIAEAPPSKSMAHRSVLCAALAEGKSHITHLEFSKDISATLGAAVQLGAEIRTGRDDAYIVGKGKLQPASQPVDCCESGSTLRFLIPLFGLTHAPTTFVGRGRLMERPQTVYEEIFREQGLSFLPSARELTIRGSLRAGEYTVAGNVSSQFISGLLFALPLSEGDSVLHLIPPVESRSYIDMTRHVQAAFGIRSVWRDGTTLLIKGGQRYAPCDYRVEGDYSQAAFLAVLGSLCGGIGVSGLSAETLQGDAVILEILRRCGAKFERRGTTVTFEKSTLHGKEIDLSDCPDLGPILMVLGLFCEGETVITHAERLRMKESDRISAMEEEIRKCGGKISDEDGIIRIRRSVLHPPTETVSGHNDHRVIMSFAVLALAAGLPLTIEGAEAVQKSWPDFFEVIKRLGAIIKTAEEERGWTRTNGI